MHRNEVKYGMKVVPHSKTSDGRVLGLGNSVEWRRAQDKGQNFLYVTRVMFSKGDDNYPEVMLGVDYRSNTGDYFHVRDFNKI